MDKFIRQVLISANEESGLWEILWDFNSTFPELTASERFEHAISALKKLLEDDMVEILESNGFTGKKRLLVPEDVISRIDIENNWIVPANKSGSSVLWIRATRKTQENKL
jgi:hypothetical protein